MSYLLCGLNALLLDERVEGLVAQLDPGGLGTTRIDVQSSSADAIASACQASPFFGGVRVVVLSQPLVTPRRGEETSNEPDEASGRVKWADLLQVLKSTPGSTIVIVRHDGSLAAGHYARKALQQLGWTTEQYEIPRGIELLSWVTARASERGFSFGPRAAERLLELLYPMSWERADPRYETSTPNTRVIASEIDKLSCAQANQHVDVALVEALIEDRSGYRAFALSDAVFNGRVERALIELDLMMEAGEAAERIVGSLASELAGIASTRALGEFAAKDVAAAAGITEGRLQALRKRSADKQALIAMAESLRHADAAVKTGAAPNMSTTITGLVVEVSEGAMRRG